MKRDWVVDVVARLPQASVSRAWGWLARRRRPRIAIELLKRGFVAATGVDMSEAADPLASYATLEELFVRPLKPGVRRVDPAPDAVVSPVDGTVGMSGLVEKGVALQLKGRSYSIRDLLGSDVEASRFEGGAYATFYLAPHNYHRIHAPFAGEVVRARAIPGALMPVFQESLEKVDHLFARNERLVTYLRSERAGQCAVVKVGATLVGRIAVDYDPTLRTNDRTLRGYRRSYEPPITIQKGGGLGAFELGSSVVVLFEAGRVQLEPLRYGSATRLGERIASVVPPPRPKSKKTTKVVAGEPTNTKRKASTSKKTTASKKTTGSKKTTAANTKKTATKRKVAASPKTATKKTSAKKATAKKATKRAAKKKPSAGANSDSVTSTTTKKS
ncbi:MAG: archaetidylserine decarboxylase [Myxococcota bacterium]